MNNIAFSPFHSTEFPSKIGYVPQSISLIDDTISFNISFEKKPNLKLLNEAIKKSNLSSYIKKLPKGIETEIGEGSRFIWRAKTTSWYCKSYVEILLF